MKTPRTALALLVAGLTLAPAATYAQAGDSLRRDLAIQMALEREGFSPGVLDGKSGAKTALAIREFQLARGLAATGQADAATLDALKADPAGALTGYTVTADDFSQVGPVPRSWTDKAKASRLPYPSLDEMLAEKFHCTLSTLAAFNPGRDIASLKVGDQIAVPNLPAPKALGPVARLEINVSQKTIRLIDAGGKTCGLLHCSVARLDKDLPRGKTSVTVITNEPTYRFDPAKWPEVKGVTHTLIIPPGPRNPVGLCWIGLGLPGYGIHGSPNPELIGKTGSHGCIRLTNWDAVRLGKTVTVGTAVTFTG